MLCLRSPKGPLFDWSVPVCGNMDLFLFLMLATQWVPFIFVLLSSHSEIHIIHMLDLLNGFFNFLIFSSSTIHYYLFCPISCNIFSVFTFQLFYFFLSAIIVLISKSSLLFSECLFFIATCFYSISSSSLRILIIVSLPFSFVPIIVSVSLDTLLSVLFCLNFILSVFSNAWWSLSIHLFPQGKHWKADWKLGMHAEGWLHFKITWIVSLCDPLYASNTQAFPTSGP